MWKRNLEICALAGLLFAATAGCEKSGPAESQPNAATKLAAQNDPICTVHWMGMKRLAGDPNAAGFLKIWRLPETAKLEAQTLDKLAVAPWRFSGTNPPPAATNYAALVRENASASLLRPLLDDLVQEESYLEIREAHDKPTQLALAVRLDRTRAGLWENNLGVVIETAAGTRRLPVQSGGTSHGWRIAASNPVSVSPLLRHVELSQSGDWTIVGFGPEQNPVFSNLVTRVQNAQAPFVGPATNSWLQTAFDLRRLSRALSWGWDLPEDWPRVSLALNGDGQNVVTRGLISFPRPLPFQIEPWNVPTNLIHEPLHSFTAVQGVKEWISSWSWWQTLHARATPNQLFCWTQRGSPFLDYAAAPMADASKTMANLGPGIMDSLNPILATNRMGKWERAAGSDGVVWARAPIIAPLVQSVGFPNGHFLFAGLSPFAATNTPPPSGTMRELLSRQDVVYFDRELTGPRTDAWIYIAQLFRVILRRAQLPDSDALGWLKAVGTTLGPSATTVTKASSTELSLTRTSSVGLTAVELQFLADWLESSQFPLRLHSTVATYPAVPARRTTAHTVGAAK